MIITMSSLLFFSVLVRVGDAAALTWSDIDYKKNVIHVTKTATCNENNTKAIGTPKSEAGKSKAGRWNILQSTL